MAEVAQPAMTGGFGATERKDAWWIGPVITALVLGGFVVYATFRTFYNMHYEVGNLLSPFYSPLLVWEGMPAWLSPAFFILWIPAGFRMTCYYYRKAYYRAFFLTPWGCAVQGTSGPGYKGETRLLLFQNLHRYFLYLALIVLVFLAIDVVYACRWDNGLGGKQFGISVGTLVLAVNTLLLTLYTISCHSFRHLVGGKLDCFSCTTCGQAQYTTWKGVSALNEHHMFWAWISLLMVAFADFYVWMVAAGKISDWRIL